MQQNLDFWAMEEISKELSDKQTIVSVSDCDCSECWNYNCGSNCDCSGTDCYNQC